MDILHPVSVLLLAILFQDKDLYLIDDIFSAVDGDVAGHIYRRCILGLLRHKTRVLATHHARYVAAADTIARLVSELGEAVIVMPGGGVTEDNLEEIRTRTKCVEFHASARVSRASEMEHQNPGLSLGSSGREYTTMVTSRDKVSNLIKIYKVNFFK